MQECTHTDLAYVGKIIKSFTSCESAFNRVGTCVDAVINSDDHASNVEAMSSLYLLFSTLRVEVDEFYKVLSEYFEDLKKGESGC